MSDKISKTDEEWRQQLNDDQYRVTRKKGTESPFAGQYYNLKDDGDYYCICCGNKLFSSETKFDSGTGWPSFFQPTDKENITEELDTAHGMRRVEVMCSKCDAHLGHVFEDGPQPTGMRYCINSVSLDFKKK